MHEDPQLPDWRQAHERLTRLAKTRARLDWKEGRLLLDAFRARAHTHLGFGSFGEYIERTLGHRRRSTDERLRVAEALERLPVLTEALRAGKTNWSIVRELTRVATSETEHAWLEAAHGRTVRQTEALVTGHRLGASPDDRFDATLASRVLRFEVSADTYATFGQALAKLRRDAGSPLDDDAALLLLARRALQGPAEEGRASYQIGLTVCEACSRGWQDGRGDPIEVGAEIVEMARCDAQNLGRIDEPSTSMDRPAGVERGAGASGARRSPTSRAHVGARARAGQSIPPATRRQVLRRDGARCVVPGCTQGVFVDLHHVVPRSEGGNHDADTLVVLCGAHHRAIHRGQLVVVGRVSTGLAFRHADGTVYGQGPHPRATAIYEEAFGALRQLGFRESAARGALQRVRAGADASAHVGAASVPSLLRQVLPLLAGGP